MARPRTLPRAGLLLVAALVLTGLIAAACGGGGSDNSDDADLSGTIEIDGSSTVFPITEAVAEEFQLANRDVRVTVGISGTGGGFKRFCSGETDVSNASRPIKASERETCAANGVEFIELPVAFDGLTVAVNNENDWVDFLTVDELNHIFRPQDPATNWSEVRDGFPDREIAVFAPGADSGTFDYFTETINGESGAHRAANTTFSEDDNVLVVGVSGEPGGIAYFGFSYYVNNQNRLSAVPIDGGSGPVAPTIATVNDGSYAPLSRPLFIYVNVESLDRPEINAFVQFYLTEARPLIDSPEVGYVQLPAAIYENGLRRVADRESGSPIGDAARGTSLDDIYGP